MMDDHPVTQRVAGSRCREIRGTGKGRRNAHRNYERRNREEREPGLGSRGVYFQ
jgi:hypothetical protein